MKPTTTINVRTSAEKIAILDVSGQITLGEGVRLLRKAIDDMSEETSGAILINMADTSHVDSAGLGLLASSYLTLKPRGGLGLISVRPNVLETLELTKLSTMLRVYPTEADALNACRAVT